MLKRGETKPGQAIYWITGPSGCGRRVAYRGVLLRMGAKRARIAILKRDPVSGVLCRVERSVDPFWVSPRADQRENDALLTPPER